VRAKEKEFVLRSSDAKIVYEILLQVVVKQLQESAA
jgi:hypothetical protein